MDEATKARVLELAATPLAQLTLLDIGFLAHTVDEHCDEIAGLLPELAWLLEEL